MVLSRFFHRELASVHHAALLLAATSAINALVALWRDRLLAGSFGASRTLDIYYAAFKVPDIVFALSLFFAASTAFIPLYLEHRERSDNEAQKFFNTTITLFCLLMAVLLVGAGIVLPFVIPYIVPGFTGAEQDLTLKLSYIILLSPPLLGLSGIVSGVVQSSRKFLSFALAPVAYNIGIIFGILVLEPRYGLLGLGLGVGAGALLHLLVQMPTLVRLHRIPWPSLSFETDPLKIVSYSFPRAIALSVNQLTLVVLTAIASTLGAGAIAIYNLSHNLYTLPLVIIGLSYSVAAFPTMAELALKKDRRLFFEHLVSATRHVLFWTLPAAALFLVFRAHIVRLVLGTGAFAWVDTHLTIASLFLFSFAIVSQSLVTLFVRGYYALGKIREPIMFNSIAALFTIVLAKGAVYVIEHSFLGTTLFRIQLETLSPSDIAFLGLPLAFSIGSFANALLLGFNLFRLNGVGTRRGLGKFGAKILTVSLAMGFSAYGMRQVLGPYFSLDTVFQLLVQAALAFVVALVVGIVLLWWLRVEEFFEVRDALRKRIFRKEILQPEVEHL